MMRRSAPLPRPALRLYLGKSTWSDEAEMAVVDPDYQRHYQFWIGFTKLMKFGVTFVVILLALLGYFLV
jgi:hypothetical protein